MAGFDQLLQILILLRVGFEVVPCRNVQRGDPGLAPAFGEIIEVDARAVGRIEEGPKAVGSERRFQA